MISAEEILNIIKDYHDDYFRRMKMAKEQSDYLEANEMAQRCLVLEYIMTDIEMESQQNKDIILLQCLK